MSVVIIPADEAQWLFKLTPPLRKFPVRRFVVHTANIEPAVVTLAVPCDHATCGEPRRSDGMEWTCDHWRNDGFRPVGTATVKHCWPIVTYQSERWAELAIARQEYVADERGNEFVPEHAQGVFIRHCEQTDTGWTLWSTDITGQVVGTPKPSETFLLELADAEATS